MIYSAVQSTRTPSDRSPSPVLVLRLSSAPSSRSDFRFADLTYTCTFRFIKRSCLALPGLSLSLLHTSGGMAYHMGPSQVQVNHHHPPLSSLRSSSPSPCDSRKPICGPKYPLLIHRTCLQLAKSCRTGDPSSAFVYILHTLALTFAYAH